MRIHVAKYEPDRIGGGWSFARNFVKGMGDKITGYDEADVFFITSASMISRDEVKQAKADGKKIVLRIDNAVRDSRNRGTGMTRMKDFCDMADLVIYQSAWAEYYIGRLFLDRPGAVIINGVDTDIFNERGRTTSDTIRFLYSRFNRDETKNWEMARFTYMVEAEREKIEGTKTKLFIVGQFSEELREYNFDFYNGEDIQYLGIISNPQLMADIYKQSDVLIYSYFNDACSNTFIEALCCGLEYSDPFDMTETGGAAEILHCYGEHGGAEYFTLERMCDDYIEAIGDII